MITDSIINKKQLDRATRMRSGDQDATVDALKEVVASSMIAQTARSKKMVNKSLQEVNQVARDIVNGQIKLDETRKKKFVGKLKNLSDDMKSQMENGDFDKKTDKIGKGLKDVLPSPQTLMSAVMTANPMLGFAMRTGGAIKGAVGSMKGAGGSDPNEEIEKTKQTIDDNFDLINSQSEDATSKITESLKPFDSDEMLNVMMGIEREMINLRKIWDDNDDTQNDIRVAIEDIQETDQEQLEESRLQRESAASQATENRREAKRVDGNGNVVSMSGEDDETESMLDDIIGGFMGGGFMAGITAVFGVLKSVAKVGGKFLGRASIIGTAIFAIYDFVDGFFNAAEILDKKESDLTIQDRIATGAGSVISGFLGMINTITSWFGLDFMSWFDGDPRKIISKGISEGINSIVDGFKSVFNRWKSIFTEIFTLFGEKEFDTSQLMNAISNIGKDLLAIPIGWANSILSAFGIVDKMDDEEVDKTIDKALGFITDSIDKVMSWMLGIFDFDIDFGSISENVGKMVDDSIESIKNFASDMVSDTWSDIKSFVGLGDDDEDDEEQAPRGGRAGYSPADDKGASKKKKKPMTIEGVNRAQELVNDILNSEVLARDSESKKGSGNNTPPPMINAPSNVTNNNTSVQTTDNTSNKDFSFGRMSYMSFMKSYE